MIMFSLFSLFLSLFPEISVLVILLSIFVTFSSNLNEVGMSTYVDSLSKVMIVLLMIISMVTLSTSSRSSKTLPFLIGVSYVVILIFFSASSLMTFFVTFEASLIPLTLIILMFGSQAERVLATQFLFVYTVIASSPLFWVVISSVFSGDSDFSLFSVEDKSEMFSIFVLAFMVKIPSFLFHSWLPKAHVEAPLEGSILLAGVMLKVGLFGLIRTMSLFPVSSWLLNSLFSISMIGAVFTSLMALSSDDMKMSVAFSSVSHMNLGLASLLTFKEVGLVSCTIVMITHGLCSPFLFYLVTSLYSLSGSRSLVISKGLFSKFPFFWFLGSILWVGNLSVPPLLSFSGEILSFSSFISFFFSSISIFLISLFLFISSFFSMLNLGVQSHSTNKLSMKTLQIDYLMPLLIVVSMVMIMMMFVFPPLLSM